MGIRTYFVINGGSDRWGVRVNQEKTAAWCKHRADAIMTARRYAARDHRNGHDAQVQIETELGFEIDWHHGAPVERDTALPSI